MYTTCKVIVLHYIIFAKQEFIATLKAVNDSCGYSWYQASGVLFQLRLAKLSITFLKKENDKVVRESVNEEKKSFLFNLRILISKIVLGFFLLNYVFCFPYRIVSTLYLLGIKENYS